MPPNLPILTDKKFGNRPLGRARIKAKTRHYVVFLFLLLEQRGYEHDQRVRKQVDCGSETNRNRYGLRAVSAKADRANPSGCNLFIVYQGG